MSPRKVDLTDHVFGRLSVTGVSGKDKYGHTLWRCVCECGKQVYVTTGNLSQGRTKSCGCWNRERTSNLLKTHGESNKSRLYFIWKNMRQRCLNPNNPRFKDYGARNITVCDEWLKSYELFRDWALSHGYEERLTLDRVNNDQGYSPSNCRWATYKEQNNNRRKPEEKEKS